MRNKIRSPCLNDLAGDTISLTQMIAQVFQTKQRTEEYSKGFILILAYAYFLVCLVERKETIICYWQKLLCKNVIKNVCYIEQWKH